MKSTFARRAITVMILSVLIGLVPPAGANARTPVPKDKFFVYTGSKTLSSYKPGAVLKTRTMPYKLLGLPLPLVVRQIVFRSTDARGRAIAAVTSVIKPISGRTTKLISYQSAYDSLNPEHGPSRALAGSTELPSAAAHVETVMMSAFLLKGYAVVMSDTQGPTADFAAGPVYGHVTLDSIRAVRNASDTGVTPDAKVGLVGYSGGAVGTSWAAALAPKYAPEINRRIVGAAEGGVLVRPAANLEYVGGSQVWSGVIPMALIGASRAYGADLTPYLNTYGRQVLAKLENASIIEGVGAYPGLTWKTIMKPKYARPSSVPEYVKIVNKLNLGRQATPTVPMFIGQGTGGELEGTQAHPGLGQGDGVMIAGDVRTLARQYCRTIDVSYRQYPLDHAGSVPLWLPEAIGWMNARFDGRPAPNNCNSIAPGNSLTPVTPTSR